MPLVSLAAWQALVDRAHVQPGQKVLVHAGSGGLGSTVIQLAKHLGATVATTARGENAELVRSLGTDIVVDYTTEDFTEVLSGYDVVLDSRGGENLERSLTVLKPGGQAIGVTGPPDPGFAKQLGAPMPTGIVMGLLSRRIRKQARKLGVHYSFLFMQANGGQLRELASLYDAGHLRPLIDKTFPFDQTLEALAYVEQSRASGKVVIALDDPLQQPWQSPRPPNRLRRSRRPLSRRREAPRSAGESCQRFTDRLGRHAVDLRHAVVTAVGHDDRDLRLLRRAADEGGTFTAQHQPVGRALDDLVVGPAEQRNEVRHDLRSGVARIRRALPADVEVEVTGHPLRRPRPMVPRRRRRRDVHGSR